MNHFSSSYYPVFVKALVARHEMGPPLWNSEYATHVKKEKLSLVFDTPQVFDFLKVDFDAAFTSQLI